MMADIDENAVLSLAANASFQKLGEGAVILMIDTGQIYTCNETTEAFLAMLDGQRNIGTIFDKLVTEFAVDRMTLAVDFLQIAFDLRSEGIVEMRNP